MSIQIVGFDADDTLWVNENYFREGENIFCKIMTKYASPEQTIDLLFQVEMENLPIYGFGIKSFVLAMVETASQLSAGQVTADETDQILAIGKDMLNKPVELLDRVEEILQHVQQNYRVILVTKGDLLDQQRKLEKSGLEKYFHHIEIMSNKYEQDYLKLIKHLDIQPEEFMMIGNSLKSDILPVINIGSQAIYVPYEITWQHEQVSEAECNGKNYIEVPRLHDVLNHL